LIETVLQRLHFFVLNSFVKQKTHLSLTKIARRNGVADFLKHTFPHDLCYHAEFGRSALKDAGINENPKTGERWNSALLGWEAWLTPRYTPLPTYGTTSNLAVL